MAIRFGTDGWRAIIADEFTFDGVRAVARAAALVLCRGVESPRRKLVLGFDRRFESDHFARAAAEELVAGGVDVLFCPEAIPTPVIAFTALDQGTRGALIVTASHNPAIFNGIKLKTAGAAPRAVVSQIERELAQPQAQGECSPGSMQTIDPFPAYAARLARLVDLARLKNVGLTVVVDAMFGVGAGVLPRLIGGDATQVIELNTAHNPLFPGIAAPEPTERNLGRLKKVVADGSATLGIAFDGDADRLAIVDDEGRYISGQLLFGLLARYILEVRRDRGPIVKSTTGSVMLDRLAAHYKVPLIETAPGFTNISQAMVDEGAVLAGEESGGFAFGLHIPDRDAILAALLLISYLVQSGKRLSELIVELEAITGHWDFRRVDLPLPPESRDALLARLPSVTWPPVMAGLSLSSVSPSGNRVEFSGGSWVLVRPSGTEPLLRLYAEAPDEEIVDHLVADTRLLLGV